MGIDAAMTKTGLIIMDDKKILYQALIVSSVTKKGHFLTIKHGDQTEKRQIHTEKNWSLFAYELGIILSDLIKKWRVNAVSLEGYSYRSVGRHHDIAEFIGTLKAIIFKNNPDVVPNFETVAKTSHYANSASAHSTKEDLISAIEYHDGIVFESHEHDIADAYSLAKYYLDKLAS